MDPLIKSYSILTPYQFASNCPIYSIDLDGLEGVPYYSFPKWVEIIITTSEKVIEKVELQIQQL